jgi:predicted anti-sigma-YlaC factor YlaD
MNRCKEIQDLLQTDYFDQQVRLQDKQLIQEHLKQCFACRELEKKLQAQRMLFQGAKPEPVPAHIWSNIREAIIAERLEQEEAPAYGILERLKSLIFLRRPVVVLATSVFSVIIIAAVFVNLSMQKQLAISKQAAAEGIAGYSLSASGSAIDDLGTNIEEYFL